ncbi:hypothetical protein MAR_016827 [Mya arenaria]|uniref:Death domain-containing protein n=1 Tax=Mya arenaria TaxID=6604 RepID=A0ABY7ECH4_MYAAR|nr:hypothetical protein MAR_016827 [Mya arenaria]
MHMKIGQVKFTEDMTLVSRIYQYKVDKTVTCDVKVEIFENDDTTGQVRSTKQYKELIIQQTVKGSETKSDCVDLPKNSGNEADDPTPLPRSESNSSVDSGFQSETSISSHSDFCSVAKRQPSLVSDESRMGNSTDGGGGPGPSDTYEMSDMGRPSSPDTHLDADIVVISLPKPPIMGVDNDGSLAVLRCNDDSFLSDRFIKDAAKCVGDKWFELGLRFGFSCEEINCFAEVADKNEKVLFVWRDDNTTANDRGLTKAMVAFKKAELPALRRKTMTLLFIAGLKNT